MLAEEEGTDSVLREFVNMSKGGMVRKMELPEARGRFCIGSMGWLITVDQEGGMELLHPLTRVSISLPHLRTYPWYEDNIEKKGRFPVHYIRGATLSASPSATEDYAVMLILGKPLKMAFWKPGNAGWTFLETTGAPIDDVIYHKGMFYAADIFSNIFACDVGGQNPTVEIVGRLPRSIYVGKLYLAEYSGELILVKKIPGRIENKCLTVDFRICKHAAADQNDDDSTTGGRRGYYKWEEVNDLGDGSIFVGFNTPISVPCAVAVGLKPNCIYFTDDYLPAFGRSVDGSDMGIYNLATRSMEPLYQGGTYPSNYGPPIWVSPCL